MARYIADVSFIASIYPGQLPVIRRHYGPSRDNEGPNAQRSTAFRLMPVPRNAKPFVLPVYDSFQSVLNVAAMSTLGNQSPHKPMLAQPVAVESIIADLLKEWTGGIFNVATGKPGVIEIHPMKVEISKFQDNGTLPGPNPGEMDELMGMQTAYFEDLFMQGEKFNEEKNWKEITDTMRIAAEWLGHERTWSHRTIARNTSPCPFCEQIISNTAIVCAKCGRQVREIPEKLAKFAAPLGKVG